MIPARRSGGEPDEAACEACGARFGAEDHPEASISATATAYGGGSCNPNPSCGRQGSAGGEPQVSVCGCSEHNEIQIEAQRDRGCSGSISQVRRLEATSMRSKSKPWPSDWNLRATSTRLRSKTSTGEHLSPSVFPLLPICCNYKLIGGLESR